VHTILYQSNAALIQLLLPAQYNSRIHVTIVSAVLNTVHNTLTKLLTQNNCGISVNINCF